MEVYFGSHYRGNKKPGEKPGIPVSVSKQFEYGGFRWICPRLYLCAEGIVLDLCRSFPAADFQRFYEKWEEKINTAGDAELSQAEKENPMNFLCDFTLFLEGKKLERMGFSGTGWQPCVPEENDAFGEEWMEEYGLARDCGWYLYRIQYPLKKSDSNRLQKELTGKPHAAISSDFLVLQLEAGKEQLFFEPAISTPVNCEPFSVPLKHPVNGREYRFYIGRCKEETYAGKIPKHFKQGMIFPEHYCVLVYAVVPELPAEEYFCVQDCAPSDAPVREDNNKKGKMASAISIIGGSDGPTAIFLAGKLSDKEILLKDLENTVPEKNPEWRTACSALTFEPVSEITWKCSVQIAPYPARKIPLTDF